MNVEEGREIDYQRLVEEAAHGLERPVRYQGFEPGEPTGDSRLEILISEVPHELVFASGLVRKDRVGDLTSQGPQEPGEVARATTLPAPEMRARIREALKWMMRANCTTMRISERGVEPLDGRIERTEHRAA